VAPRVCTRGCWRRPARCGGPRRGEHMRAAPDPLRVSNAAADT
jgi:hypothetical protein